MLPSQHAGSLKHLQLASITNSCLDAVQSCCFSALQAAHLPPRAARARGGAGAWPSGCATRLRAARPRTCVPPSEAAPPPTAARTHSAVLLSLRVGPAHDLPADSHTCLAIIALEPGAPGPVHPQASTPAQARLATWHTCTGMHQKPAPASATAPRLGWFHEGASCYRAGAEQAPAAAQRAMGDIAAGAARRAAAGPQRKGERTSSRFMCWSTDWASLSAAATSSSSSLDTSLAPRLHVGLHAEVAGRCQPTWGSH